MTDNSIVAAQHTPAHTAVTVTANTMAANVAGEPVPQVQQPEQPSAISTVAIMTMLVSGIGRAKAPPREARRILAPAMRWRSDSMQATGRRTGISSNMHTANPTWVPNAMPSMTPPYSPTPVPPYVMQLQYTADPAPLRHCP